MAINPPWINPDSFCTARVGSTPTLIFGTQLKARIDSIRLVNLTKNDIYVTAKLKREIDLVDVDFHIHAKARIQPYSARDLLTFEEGGFINANPGDTIFANSDFSGNLFDCIVSYREILEVTI